MSRDSKMLDFGLFFAVKCDLFYAREASISLKMPREMRIIDATLVNGDSNKNKNIFGGLSEVLGQPRHPNVTIKHVSCKTAFFLSLKHDLYPPSPPSGKSV